VKALSWVRRAASARRTSLLSAVLVSCFAPFSFAQKTDPALLQRYFQAGEQALAQQRYEEAAAAYDKLLQLDPSVAEVHARLGLVYFQQGRFSKAVPALRQALKLKPSLPNTDILLSMSLNELGNHTEALPGLQKGFRQTKDGALRRMAGLQLQRAYTGLQEDSKAVEVALEMTRLHPEDPEVLYHAGQLFGNFAYVTMQQLSKVAPTSIWTIQAIGEARDSQGDYPLAVARYRQVIAMSPKRPGIHLRLGRALLRQDRKLESEAIQAFEQELAIDPTNANAAYELAVIHLRNGRHADARDGFKQALKHYPDFQEAEVGLGRALVGLGQASAAVAHFQKAISLKPDDDVSYFHLARAHRELGNRVEQQKALAEFQRLRSQRPAPMIALQPDAVTRQEVDPETTP
jgi:tetratricopeptide (TPR) repeat protein